MRRTLSSALAAAVATALLVACSAPQAEPERPFQVTPVAATPDPNVLGGGAQNEAYPDPGATVVAGAYPAPGAEASPTAVPERAGNGRSQTALEALPIAEAVAREEFTPDARFAGVLISEVMLINLGNPPVSSGWFFKFNRDDTNREFIVHVVDGVVTGTVETETVDPPVPPEIAVPLDRVTVDSDRVYELFAQRAPELGIAELPDPQAYDLELVYIEGGANPVWSVYNPVTLTWLMSVDASTGAEVPNPRG